MPKFVIEREIPGSGKLSFEELLAISQKSCGALRGMGPQIQWVYVAANEETVREQSRKGGFPASRVSRFFSVIDPTTAE